MPGRFLIPVRNGNTTEETVGAVVGRVREMQDLLNTGTNLYKIKGAFPTDLGENDVTIRNDRGILKIGLATNDGKSREYSVNTTSALLLHTEPIGTDGGGTTTNLTARKLNTLAYNEAATVKGFNTSNYTFQLGRGIYDINLSACFRCIVDTRFSLTLYNVTASTEAISPAPYAVQDVAVATTAAERDLSNHWVTLLGRISPTKDTTFDVRDIVSVARPTYGRGLSTAGYVNTYCRLLITRIS